MGHGEKHIKRHRADRTRATSRSEGNDPRKARHRIALVNVLRWNQYFDKNPTKHRTDTTCMHFGSALTPKFSIPHIWTMFDPDRSR